MTARGYLATEDTEATETTELRMNADQVIASEGLSFLRRQEAAIYRLPTED
jgi:hypothetical protein